MLNRALTILEPRSETAILPREGTTGTALVIVMTIMSFLACLAIWATLSIAAATHSWTSGIVNTVTVELKPPESGAVDPGSVKRALAIIEAASGVKSARALEAKETSALIEPWLGSAGIEAALPLPVLIDVKLSARNDFDADALRAALQKSAPGATLDDHRRWTTRLMAVSRSLIIIAMTVLLLVLLAATAIIVFATRAGLLAHSGIVEILHLSGAHSEFIATEFARHFLRLGVRAGALGVAAALVTVLIAALATAAPGNAGFVSLAPQISVSPLSFATLLLVPVGAAFIATLTARLTVLRTLNRLP